MIRALYIVVGFTILLLGLVMLITPGPAFVVIPFGLALLSLEFAWAERLLDKALEKGEQAKAKAAGVVADPARPRSDRHAARVRRGGGVGRTGATSPSCRSDAPRARSRVAVVARGTFRFPTGVA